jgi:hypothetical protein
MRHIHLLNDDFLKDKTPNTLIATVLDEEANFKPPKCVGMKPVVKQG